MKVSLSDIRYYKDLYKWSEDPAPNGVDELVQKIGAQLAAIEEVTDFGKTLEDVVIVKVVSCEKHPNADKLHVCKVDDGGKVQNVERDDKGLVQVVCGAPNVHAGMLAAWLSPGTTVPSTVDNEPFVLSAREFRGVMSNGMMASPKELGLGESHEGILDIDETLGPIVPGSKFVDVFGLRGDAVIDMENKMFTHRPDCFGMMGVAREIAGIQHQKFTSPEWYRQDAIFDTPDGPLKVEVKNELPDLVPRFVAVPMSDVTVKPSPVWVQISLVRLGVRPINNIVDLTNYYMLLTGQPLHAYDYDKVKKLSNSEQATIVVRHPKKGEKLTLLSGKEIEPRSEAIMIATDKELIGVGGVMGGADTEVDDNTKNIIFECANFDMYSIRRTSMAHGLFTDAVTRFNKGQSPLQNMAIISRIVADAENMAGAKLAGKLVDDNNLLGEIRRRGSVHASVKVTTKFINDRLGWKLSAEDMAKLLTNVEFKVEISGDALTVTAPFWRTDIEIPEDIVEEIGRLNGYDKLLLDLPKRDLTPAARNPLIEFKSQVRKLLSAAGANEMLSYTFVHGNLFYKVSQNRELAFQVANALSPDLQYFRLSLTPSLLDRVHPNIKAGHNEFALFELGKVHSKDMMDEEGLPREFNRIALTFAADDKTAAQKYAGAPYYQALKYLDVVLAHYNVAGSLEWQPLSAVDLGKYPLIEQMTKPYEPNRSAVFVKDGLVVGVIGEYRRSVQRALKLPSFSAGFEIFHSFLLSAGSANGYVQLPRFPKVEQDICLKVSADMAYGDLFRFVEQHLQQNRPDQTYHTLTPVDIYQREDDSAHKQITLRLSLASYERTLTDQEVNKLLEQVAESAKQQFNAERI